MALSNGVVADIATSAERGSYIGWASVGTILGPTLSPILGGLLSRYLGWAWIFWFQTIFAASFFLPFLLFFPETCRAVVSDGSIPPPRCSMFLMSLWRGWRRAKAGIAVDSARREALAKTYRLCFPNPLTTLVIIANKEAGLILFSTGLVIACLFTISVGLPSQFSQIYGFNDVQLGLVYIPFGCGSLISAFTMGMAIDWNYRRHAQRLGLPVIKNRQRDIIELPIEKMRLQVALPFFFLGAAAMIAYGWVLHSY